MHELHAEARKAPAVGSAKRPRTMDVSSSLAAPAQPAASVTHAAASSVTPFAVIDEVSANSPAEEAGLHVGDQLISFADISGQTANALPAIAAALQVHTCNVAKPIVCSCLMPQTPWPSPVRIC